MWLDCLYVPSHYPRPATPVLSPLTHPLTHIRSAPVFPRLRNLAPPATSVRFCKLLMCSPLLGVYDTTKTATDRLSASGAGFLSPFLGIISFPDFRLECMWLHNPGRSFFFFRRSGGWIYAESRRRWRAVAFHFVLHAPLVHEDGR